MFNPGVDLAHQRFNAYDVDFKLYFWGVINFGIAAEDPLIMRMNHIVMIWLQLSKFKTRTLGMPARDTIVNVKNIEI